MQLFRLSTLGGQHGLDSFPSPERYAANDDPPLRFSHQFMHDKHQVQLVVAPIRFVAGQSPSPPLLQQGLRIALHVNGSRGLAGYFREEEIYVPGAESSLMASVSLPQVGA